MSGRIFLQAFIVLVQPFYKQ